MWSGGGMELGLWNIPAIDTSKGGRSYIVDITGVLYSLFDRQWYGMVHREVHGAETRKMPSSPRWTMSCGSTM